MSEQVSEERLTSPAGHITGHFRDDERKV